MKTICPTTTNKVVVVTGGAKGIGAQIVRRFSVGGYSVVISCLRSEVSAARLAHELTESGGRAIVVKADLSTESGAKTLREAVISAYGRIDVLVNNAGSACYGALGDMTSADVTKTVGDGLLSAVYTTRAFYDDFAFGGRGAIVNISSVWGLKGSSAESVYSAAKFGVIGLTKSLAKELAPSGVRVNAIAPGVIDTDMLSHFTEAERADMLGDIPLGRFGTPADVAEVAYFLASDKSSYITGEVINVSGGYVI